MVSSTLFRGFAAAIIATAFAGAAYSQNDKPQAPPPDEVRFGPPPGQAMPPDERRPSLLQELGLSREQIQAVRRMNQARKPVEETARKRFQDANRALNMAIYADTVDDADFKSKLSEFQAAQAELARIKFHSELAVRKILTPVQLVRFRELRRRFAEAREDMRDSEPPAGRPIQRLRRGNQPPIN